MSDDPLEVLSCSSTLPVPLARAEHYNGIIERFPRIRFAESRRVNIVKYPHPTLRHVSKPLRKVDAELRTMIREMFELMYASNGIGLAANQVDLPYRMFIINLTADPAAVDEEHVFLNPEILARKGALVEREEGCLSLPDIYAPVRRHDKVMVNAYDLSGQEFTYELSGLFARAVQHEYDHLDGIVFVDRLSPTNTLNLKNDLDALEREFARSQDHGQIPPDASIVTRLNELEQLRT